MDRDQLIKAVADVLDSAQAAIREIDARAEAEKAPHLAKLKMLESIISKSSDLEGRASQDAVEKPQAIGLEPPELSPRAEVIEAAVQALQKIALEETPETYTKAADLAVRISAMGLHLGDDAAERTRRVTTVLSGWDCFEAQRGAGWRLAPRWRPAKPAALAPSQDGIAETGRPPDASSRDGIAMVTTNLSNVTART